MPTLSRRHFLKTASLATASLWAPQFLQAFQRPGALAHKGRILVVLQLSGGNDGLNTVVPVRNDIYYRERPRLAIKREEALALGTEAGLHPMLQGMKGLYDDGYLGILHNVGYPNPDRSHFRSMDIWHSASPADQYWNTGWLGRYLDAQCRGCERPTATLEIDDTLSLALKGGDMKGLALLDPKRLYDTARSPYFADYAAAQPRHDPEAPVGYLYKTMTETLASADYLYEKTKARPTGAGYPDSEIGRSFRTIASLILADTDTSVYYLSHGSFDTHVNQSGQQSRLFKQMDEALAAFAADMRKNGRWNDVLVVTFSEFGRRVAQNAGSGTDHGTANQMFFMGGALRQKGLINDLPNLADLDKGDLKYNIDFRQVYATLLEKWLQTLAEPVLQARFDLMGFV